MVMKEYGKQLFNHASKLTVHKGEWSPFLGPWVRTLFPGWTEIQ